jgi:hypothetical protein
MLPRRAIPGGTNHPRSITRCGREVGCGMRIGKVEVRPLGGGLGCLLMILFSVLVSIVCTVLLNILI